MTTRTSSRSTPTPTPGPTSPPASTTGVPARSTGSTASTGSTGSTGSAGSGPAGSAGSAPAGGAPITVVPALARRAIERRSFATLATTSPAGVPHVAGVLYAAVAEGGPAGLTLYVSTAGDSRKARNIAADPRVAVCIPVRRVPVGPPSSVQFQARAEILPVDHPDVVRLAAAGELDAVTSHGELDLPGGCIVRIEVPTRVLTFGLGMSLRALLRDPLAAAGSTDLAAGAA